MSKKNLMNIELQNFIQFNPKETLPKGSVAKKIPMEMLKPHTRKIIGYEKNIYSTGAKFRNKDTLLAKITPCLENGKTAQVGILEDNEIAFGSTEFIVLRSIENISDSDFIYYLSKSPSFRKKAISCMEGTSGRKRVNEKTLKEQILPVPTDIEKQKNIAQLLLKIDNKIELNNKINEELEKLAKTLYDYWFVQFDFPDEFGRPYKSSGGAMVYNDDLKREVPIDFEIKYVKDFLDVVTGKEDANFSDENGQYAFFTCGDEILKCNQPAFSGKSILIAGNGNFNIKYYEGEFNAYQRTYVLIPNDNLFVGIIYLSALNRINAFTKGSNGSIVKFITKGDVENIPVIIPKNKNILSVFNKLLDKQNHIRYENEKLKNLRDFLLPMLMNGQVTIQQ